MKTKTNKITGGCGINMRPYLNYSAYFNPTSGGGIFNLSNLKNKQINQNRQNNQSNQSNQNNQINNQIRNFSLVDYPNKGHNYGNFIANTPLQAAHKAFRQLLNNISIKEDQLIVFTIMDNNNHKEFQYIGTPVKLIRPVQIQSNSNNKPKIYNQRFVVSRYYGDLEDYRLNPGFKGLHSEQDSLKKYGGGYCKTKCGNNRIYNNKKFFVITKK